MANNDPNFPILDEQDLGSIQNWMSQQADFGVDDLNLNDFEPSAKTSKREEHEKAHYNDHQVPDELFTQHQQGNPIPDSNSSSSSPFPSIPFNPQTIHQIPHHMPPIPPHAAVKTVEPSPSFFPVMKDETFSPLSSSDPNSHSSPYSHNVNASFHDSQRTPQHFSANCTTPSSGTPYVNLPLNTPTLNSSGNNNNSNRSSTPENNYGTPVFSPFSGSNIQSGVIMSNAEGYENNYTVGYHMDENVELFNQYFNDCNIFAQNLEQIKQEQLTLLSQFNRDGYAQLISKQEALKRTFDEHLRSLNMKLRSALLPPPDIVKIFSLKTQINTYSTQLELYFNELNSFASNQTQNCNVTLAIVEQDYLPLTLQKGKASDEGITLQILQGAQCQLSQISPASANVVLDPLVAKQISGGSTSTKNLENDTQNFTPDLKATFHPKFTAGSRKTLATLKFSTKLNYNGVPITLQSLPSNPFLITTNDIQFEEAEGILLRHFVFGNARDTEVPWNYLANILHAFFLRATRQDPLRPVRSLSTSEIHYLHSKFFGEEAMVSCKTFESFYDWFGKNLQKIRFQRHLCSMYQSGLIYGFVNRDFVQQLLQDQPKGTFIIRFSERHPGTIAICYVIEDPNPQNRVRHYLISSDDVYSAKKTLPDFLIEWNIFTNVIQVSRDSSGNIIHTLIDKSEALDHYRIKKSNPNEKKGGYDHELIGGKG